MECTVRDIIIMGTGPAGYTAAIYTGRANLKPLVIEGFQPGGQLMITSEIENFPGFPAGIRGPELMAKMREQAAKFDAEFVNGSVTEVDLSRSPFCLALEDGREFLTHALIVATGANAKWLGIKSEGLYRGKGVSACATCDGFFFRDGKVFVVGGGDTAMEEALYLTKFASHVTLIHRREEFRSSKIMSLRTRKNPKISMMLNEVVDEILGDRQKVTGIRLKNVLTGELSEHACDGVFWLLVIRPIQSCSRISLILMTTAILKQKNHQQKPVCWAFSLVAMSRTTRTVKLLQPWEQDVWRLLMQSAFLKQYVEFNSALVRGWGVFFFSISPQTVVIVRKNLIEAVGKLDLPGFIHRKPPKHLPLMQDNVLYVEISLFHKNVLSSVRKFINTEEHTPRNIDFNLFKHFSDNALFCSFIVFNMSTG